jgi:hypothetical protein
MKCIIAVVACCSTFLFLTCMQPLSGNGSDVGNAKTCLVGHLVDGRTGMAAQDAMARVYPTYLNKVAQTLGKTASNPPAVDSTRCDHSGAYRFDSLGQGIYSIVGEKIDGTDTLTMRHPGVLLIDSKDIGYDTLRLPGRIKGKVVVPAGESAKNVTCYIPGTSYIAITNDSGGFKITGIPEGIYSLSFSSSRFNDTTLYNKTVISDAEADIGNVTLSFDMSKNVHDVWGVFDSTSKYQVINRIEARVSGDGIPVDSPRIYPLDWRPDVAGYSGFIYVPSSGSFWKVAVWVYDLSGHRIGVFQIPINRSTGDIQFPSFNPCDGIPLIGLNDTTVNTKDTVQLHPVISTLPDDSIVSMEWDIGNTGTFVPTSAPETLIIAPVNPTVIRCVFRITDIFGNQICDTMTVRVVFSSMVAYWSFDSSSGNTYYDMTGHGYDAVATGTGVGVDSGVSGRALNCPLNGYEITVANSLGNFNLTRFSIESWVYLDTDPSAMVDDAAKIFDNQYIAGTGGIRNGYSLYVEPTGHVAFSLSNYNGSVWNQATSSMVIASQTWYFVTATYDSAYVRIYVNGVLNGSKAFQGTCLAPGLDARIGCQHRTNGIVSRFLNGRIDELKLFNYALPSDSIAAHYLSANP